MISTLTLTVAPTAKDLTRLDTVKSELSIADGSKDAWLTSAIGQASDAIAAFCRRPEGFGRATWEQTWRTGLAMGEAISLILSRDIAPSITSVVEDGVTLSNTDYLLDGALLRRLKDDQPICWRARKIVVAYDAGWALLTDLPYDVERCCIDLVVRAHQSKGRDPGLRSERILDIIAQSWDTPGGDGFKEGLPRDIADRLANYVRWIVA